MAYSFAQLEGFWVNAGGSATLAPIMAAIALAESGGNPNATNPNDNGGRQTSWGLWQISLGNHNAPAPNWNDPAENASLAVAKYNSQGLGAWGTYTSGAYSKYLQAGVAPDLTVSSKTADPGGGGGAPGGGTSSGGTGCDKANCVFSVPTPANTIVNTLTFGLVNTGGCWCLLTKSMVKWLSGVAALVGGAAFFGFGVVMIAGYAYDNSGAKQAVNTTARRVGVGTALLTGQPEIAAGLAATGGKGKGKSSRTRSSSTMGRRESRSYERMYRDMMAENGDRTRTGAPSAVMRQRAREASTRSVSDEGQSAAAVRTRQRQQRERRQRRSVHYNEEGVGF